METQRIRGKIIKILSVLFFFTLQAFGNQPNEKKLKEADVLFQKQKYMEALKKYEQLMQEKGSASPSMLLKMAFIQEGLGEYDQSLYYLNLYYSKSPEIGVLEKMQSIADKEHLEGYDFSDKSYFMNGYLKYKTEETLFLLILALAFTAVFYIYAVKFKTKKISWAVASLSMLVLLLAHVNMFQSENHVILLADESPLMAGPSSGAQMISELDKGNKLKITGEKDVWYQVEWNGEKGYIKKSNGKRVL